MENTENLYLENRSLRFTTLIYYAIMIVALMVGLYGFLSLFWMASSAFEHNTQLLNVRF